MHCPCGVNPASNPLVTGNPLTAWRDLCFAVLSILHTLRFSERPAERDAAQTCTLKTHGDVMALLSFLLFLLLTPLTSFLP